MGTVRLAFSPMPAHVRTVRLVAVATAREAGVEEAILDEIRLAVGEACARAVGVQRLHSRTDLVVVEFLVGSRFGVTVTDTAPADPPADGFSPAAPFAAADGLAEDDLVAGVGRALLTGLVEDVSVTSAADGVGTVVAMSWPLA